ncbi:MAG TPA: TRAP transporter substrate-binding protein [Gammaproteobacteria bacterium]|nr:TRAP transporter substrate-binding protein [Gammaproteobacteria bacterium]
MRRNAWVPLFVLLGLLGISLAGSASAAVKIKIGWPTSNNQKIDPYAIMAHDFAKKLNQIAPGQFDVQFFPNHQLGTEVQMLQQMEVGALDAGVITGAKIAQIIPAFKVNDLPFIYTNVRQAERILDGPVGKTLLKDLEAKNIIGFGFSIAGFRDVINNVRPIHKPGDLHGLKIRVQPNDLFIATFKALGANPVPMDWNDVFTAVQQGTVDGLEIPLAVIYANKYAEVTKYLSLTKHAFNADALVMSKMTFDRLSAKEKKEVRKAAAEAIKEQRKTVIANNKELIAKLKAAGMKVNKVSNLDAFKEKVKPLYKKYAKKIGQNLVSEVLKEERQGQ